MDDSARKSFAEALSGFVNAEGGVIIWGGNCRKNSSGEDVLQELIPVPNILKFTSELQELTPQLVAPAIVGVRNEFFEDEHGSGAGYAITYVPEGEGLPHMAMGKNQSRYMFRSGSSFLAMPHWMVADRFGRRPHPALRLIFDDFAGSCRLFIENYGAATAKFPGFLLKRSATFYTASFDNVDTDRRIVVSRDGDAVWGQANSELIIHPKRILQIGAIHWGSTVKPFKFEYELFAENTYVQDMFEII
jgi:hypothetical protein